MNPVLAVVAPPGKKKKLLEQMRLKPYSLQTEPRGEESVKLSFRQRSERGAMLPSTDLPPVVLKSDVAAAPRAGVAEGEG